MSEARREDVETLDGILKALYEVLSGPPGPRDWDRQRTLLAPGARLMPTRSLEDEARAVDVFDQDGYIASRSPFFASHSFLEVEIARRVERFGAVAHVWSTYESRYAADEEPFVRGINSIQLFHDGKRWWVLSALWDIERPDNLLPVEYLPAGEPALLHEKAPWGTKPHGAVAASRGAEGQSPGPEGSLAGAGGSLKRRAGSPSSV